MGSFHVTLIVPSPGVAARVVTAVARVAGVMVERPGPQGVEQAVLEYADGLLIRARQFDGGESRVSYHETGPLADLPRQLICANGMDLTYDYDSTGGLIGVGVGSSSRIELEYDAAGRIVEYTCRASDD